MIDDPQVAAVLETEDNGGILWVQIVDGDGQVKRFTAYAKGLGTIGSKGQFRISMGDPWHWAVVDHVEPIEGYGSVYCVHVVTAP